MKRVMVAFSGGVDSTFLLKVSRDVLGFDNLLAVIGRSGIRFEDELKSAISLAESLDVRYTIIETEELKNEKFIKNDELRCYYCKFALFRTLKEIAKSKEIYFVLDGTNYDDVSGDYRPGIRALKEIGISSPLKDAELTKAEIRVLSKNLNLPTWNKSPETCLATRFPYGIQINSERLVKISGVESFLASLNLKVHRARYHDDHTLRIEILPQEMDKIMNRREEVVKKIKVLGFNYVALDLEGYRSGSLNEVNKKDDR